MILQSSYTYAVEHGYSEFHGTRIITPLYQYYHNNETKHVQVKINTSLYPVL